MEFIKKIGIFFLGFTICCICLLIPFSNFNAKHIETINQYEIEIEELNCIIDDLTVQIDNYLYKNSELEKDVEDLNIYIVKIRKEYENEILSLNSDIDNLNSIICDLNSVINDLNVIISDLNIVVESLNSDIEDLNLDINGYISDIENLQQQVESLNARILKIQSRYENEIEKLNNVIVDLNSNINDYLLDIEKLEKQVEDLNIEINDYLLDIETLESELETTKKLLVSCEYQGYYLSVEKNAMCYLNIYFGGLSQRVYFHLYNNTLLISTRGASLKQDKYFKIDNITIGTRLTVFSGSYNFSSFYDDTYTYTLSSGIKSNVTFVDDNGNLFDITSVDDNCNVSLSLVSQDIVIDEEKKCLTKSDYVFSVSIAK